MGFTSADLPDLSGTTAVVTGANSGIGYVTARELARHGAAVTLACRNADKAEAARAKILADVPDGSVDVGVLDLARLKSGQEFAAGWDGPLDLLVNNAGVMAPLRRRITEDGFELQMGTNHLGHFALTGRLLPALLAAPRPRVVTVSSLAHTAGVLDNLQALDDLQSVAGYTPQRSYGNAKLANLMFALELQRRAGAAGSNLVSTAAHPGLADTGVVTNRDGVGGSRVVRMLAPLNKVISQSAEAGALSTLYAATVAEPGSYTGPSRLHETRGAPGPARVSESASDPVLAAELWEISSALTDVTYAWS